MVSDLGTRKNAGNFRQDLENLGGELKTIV